MFHYEQGLVDFLAQPENLPTALEVGAHIEQVKDKIQIAFWLAIQTKLESLLRQSDLHHTWEVQCPPSAWEPVGNWYWCCLQKKGHLPKTANHLCIQLQQANRNTDHRLYYGIRWNEEPSDNVAPAAAQGLISRLVDAGFHPSPPWYVGLRDLDHYARRSDFLIAMAECPGDLITQISQLFWMFFEEWQSEVMQVDAELAV